MSEPCWENPSWRAIDSENTWFPQEDSKTIPSHESWNDHKRKTIKHLIICET